MSKSIWGRQARTLVIAMTLVGFVGLISGCDRSQETAEQISAGQPVVEEQVAPVVAVPVWSMQADCGGCHTTEAASKKDGVHLASKHAEVPCILCHQNEAKLSIAHTDMTKTPSQTWLNSPIDNTTCFTCHIDWQNLAGLTTTSQALVDTNGLVVNPHAIPATASHNQNPYCFVCHEMHLDAKPANEYCLGCHHQGVFECNTCHKPNDYLL